MEKRLKKLGRREKNRGKNREKRNLTARSSPLLGVDKHSCCRQSGKRRNTSMVARQDCNFRVLVKPSTQLTKSWGAWRNAFMTIWLAYQVLKKAKQANRNLCKAAKMKRWKDHKRSYGKEKTWKGDGLFVSHLRLWICFNKYMTSPKAASFSVFFSIAL